MRIPTYESILVWRNSAGEGGPQTGHRESQEVHADLSVVESSQSPGKHVRGCFRQGFQHGGARRITSSGNSLNQVVQGEPIESLDPVTLGYFASIGIEKGKPFAPDARMKKILTEAAAVGDATARALTYQEPDSRSFLLSEQHLASVAGRL